MIDIHTHILYGVDDGSQDLETSMEMVRLASAGGTSVIVATPHNGLPGLRQELPDLTLRLEKLRQSIKEARIPVTLVKGTELFATWELPELLRQKAVWTLNDTRYFLTEFDFDEDPVFCMRVLERCREDGFLPVIAHPERYDFIQRSPEIVYDWFCEGYGIQLNKGSLLGRFGTRARRTAHLLMRCGLVSCIASDAHSAWRRTPHMAETRELVEEDYGSDYAHLVFEDNPNRILSGRPLTGYEPIYPRM